MEDLSHSETVTAGDDWDIQIACGATGTTIAVYLHSILFTPTTAANTLSKIFCTNGITQSTSSASTTFFFLVDNNSDTESFLKCRLRSAFTAKNLAMNVITKGRGSNDTVGIRVNGVSATGPKITITGTGIFEDTSGTQAYVAGDDFSFFFTTGSGSGTDTWASISVEMISTAGTALYISSLGTAGRAFVNQTVFQELTSSLNFGGGETQWQDVPKISVQFLNLGIGIRTNTLAAGNFTWTFRKNLANTALAITIAHGTTGLFEDTSDKITLVASDTFDYQMIAPNTTGTVNASWTKIEAIYASTLTKTFTIDAILVNRRTKTFTIDAILKATKSKTFSIDAIIVNRRSKTFTIDAILQKQSQTKTFKIDSILKATLTKIFKIDAYLQKQGITKIFKIDSLLKATFSKTFKIDALIQKQAQTKTFLIDAYLRATKTKSFSIDALLQQKGKFKTFSTDALLKATLHKTFSIDAIVVNRRTKTFLVDAYIQRQANQKLFRIDAYLKATFQKSFTIDGLLYVPNISLYPISVYMSFQGPVKLKTISLSGKL